MVSDFSDLVASIRSAHEHFAARAVRAVNLGLTLRNWIVGGYIQEYEQGGSDRAEYAARLFERLSDDLAGQAQIRYHPRELRRCRLFYQIYPEIGGTLSPESHRFLPAALDVEIRGTPSPESRPSAQELVASLSYSHFVELLGLADPLQRAFYETECVRGQWSVRELKRQISSLLYERTRLSTDRNALMAQVHAGAERGSAALTLRDPYVFEFLGLKARETMAESQLEDALLEKVQDFLLELGRGFCFEARQKRIRIGDDYFFVDLVFYHRILKCHVLIELKVDEFRHEYLGQLNTYVNWFRRHEGSEGDNPPVGLLLCTRKNHALMEYALAGMDNQLFVSRYQLELPKKEELERFLEAEMREQDRGEVQH